MWYFVFFTFSDKALGCKSFLATLNGHMTLGWGDPDCFFWRETDWQSVLVTFLVNLWLGCVGGNLSYLQKHTRFSFISSTEVITG